MLRESLEVSDNFCFLVNMPGKLENTVYSLFVRYIFNTDLLNKLWDQGTLNPGIRWIAQDDTELGLTKNTMIWVPRTSRIWKKIHRAH